MKLPSSVVTRKFEFSTPSAMPLHASTSPMSYSAVKALSSSSATSVYTAIGLLPRHSPVVGARPACLLGAARIQSGQRPTAAEDYDTSQGRGRGESMNGPIPAQKEPYGVNVEAGKRYFWCACGRSASQPFCDGSHQGTGLTPVPFTAEATEEVWLCGCKATGGKPFCDGTHNTL